MTNGRKRLEKALRGCAEAGVPDSMDLWPAVREHATGERASAEPVATERADTGSHQRSWVPRPVPNTPLGWALAAVSVLIVGVSLYAGIEPARELFRQGLPGTVEPGSEKANRTPGPSRDDGRSGLLTPVGETRTADGAKVTLKWAYADEKFVAVGLETTRAEGPEGSGQSDPDSAVLEPALWDDSVGNEAELPPYVKIADASGQDFDTVGGGTSGERADATFDAPEGIEPGREHRFRLEVPVQEGPALSGRPEAGPFVFDFEIPVRPAPTIELDQKVEAEGVTLTLKRVVDSPLVPQAVICFDPPDDEHRWTPWLRYDKSYEERVGSAPQRLENGCWSLMMAAPVEGRSSVTVANLEGMPTGPSDPGQTSINPKTIRGPWTFEFDAPER